MNKACMVIRPQKIVMLPLTCTKFENWFGRSIFFFYVRVEFTNILFKVSKWAKRGRNAVKTQIKVLF